MTDNTCPRCLGQIPNNETPGAYPGALSRVADVYICSACGQDEAMQQFFNGGTAEMEDWPVEHQYGPMFGVQ